MENVRLPRHVIDRLENRWASRLQQEVRAWRGAKKRFGREMQTDGARAIPVIVKRARAASVKMA